MADDLDVTPGTGAKLRSTNVSGVTHLQHVLAGEKTRVSDGDATLTLSGSSQALPSIPGASTHATVYLDAAADTDIARYLEGNTAPTASAGKRLKDHEEIEVSSLSTFHAIIGTGTTLILRIFYYHYS